MVFLIRAVPILLVFTLWVGQALVFSQDLPRLVRVEFRWAETFPGKGLTEATVLGTGEKIYLHKEVIITNKDIIEARAVNDPLKKDGIYQVKLVFTKQAAARMAKSTPVRGGQRLAILVDGKVVSAPFIHGSLYDRVAISGDTITKEDAERIARALNQRSRKITR